MPPNCCYVSAVCVTRGEEETVGRDGEKKAACLLLWVVGVCVWVCVCFVLLLEIYFSCAGGDRQAQSRRAFFTPSFRSYFFFTFSLLPFPLDFHSPFSLRMPNAELYIYGGAFGLPSIDPQCLALISYLSIVSHQEYTIVESNDPGISPTGTIFFLSLFLSPFSLVHVLVSRESNQ